VASVTDNAIAVEPFVDRNRLEYVRAVDFSAGAAPSPPRNAPVEEPDGQP
jgi:hypothetical protein